MPEFKTWRAFWNFEREVTRHRRYIRSAAADQFLNAVRQTCVDRIRTINRGFGLWRSQLGHDWKRNEQGYQVEWPFPAKRMSPPHDRATEGRVNPKGIPVIYLSTTKEAAMSEVRPWLASIISAGYFETVRTLKVIDCSRYHSERHAFHLEKDEPPPEERTRIVWTDIDRAFSTPVTRSDDTSDYTATQILSELFRESGFDGIAYKSAFGSRAFTIALFDLKAVTLHSCHLYKVGRARFEFKDQSMSYWVTRKKRRAPRAGAN